MGGGGGGGLIQNSTFKRGGLIQKSAALLEDGLVVSRKYVAKATKKRPEVLKNELDKRAIKLNCMKLGIGVMMQKYSEELVIR